LDAPSLDLHRHAADDRPFDYVINVATNPANAGQAEVLAATIAASIAR
jgi:hypothetical protein